MAVLYLCGISVQSSTPPKNNPLIISILTLIISNSTNDYDFLFHFLTTAVGILCCVETSVGAVPPHYKQFPIDDYLVCLQPLIFSFPFSIPQNYKFPNSMELRKCMEDYFEPLTEEQALQLVVKSEKARSLLIDLDEKGELTKL